jgi:hypothetical protein
MTMSGSNTPLRSPMQSSNTITRIADVTAQDSWVTGDVIVRGAGEVIVEVIVPLTFGERPLPILGGGEYVSEITPEPGNFPTANAIIVGWIKEGEAESYYSGVKIGIVTTGRSNQMMRVSFAFMGMALTNMATDTE